MPTASLKYDGTGLYFSPSASWPDVPARKIREEEVMACVVPMPGATGDAHLAIEFVDWCLGRLAYFKAPGFMLFVDRLPTTGTQKVQKTQIFPRGEDPRRRPGAIDLRARKKRTAP